ncbi:MAG: hypothetical protein NVS2B7_36070 [Herpetosiphon sp.]
MEHQAYSAEQFCYLTTTGRKTGRLHRIEIWFALHANTLYLLSGGGAAADWVRNGDEHPDVLVELGPLRLPGCQRRVIDRAEDALARDLVWRKYATGDDSLESWRDTALPIAIDLPREHVTPHP